LSSLAIVLRINQGRLDIKKEHVEQAAQSGKAGLQERKEAGA
jgi:hypothetical protein